MKRTAAGSCTGAIVSAWVQWLHFLVLPLRYLRVGVCALFMRRIGIHGGGAGIAELVFG